MKSIINAYQAYERRGIRGEMVIACGKPPKRTNLRDHLMGPVGDLVIQIGLKLKRRRDAGKPVALSLLTGSVP